MLSSTDDSKILFPSYAQNLCTKTIRKQNWMKMHTYSNSKYKFNQCLTSEYLTFFQHYYASLFLEYFYVEHINGKLGLCHTLLIGEYEITKWKLKI